MTRRAWSPLGGRGAYRASARSTSGGSTGYLAFQASKPPSRAAALKPNLFSLRRRRCQQPSSVFSSLTVASSRS